MKQFKLFLISFLILLGLTACNNKLENSNEESITTESDLTNESSNLEESENKDEDALYLVAKSTSYLQNGSISGSEEYEYNENGNVIKYSVYKENNKLSNITYTSYDNNGYTNDEKMCLADGTILSWKLWENTPDGFIISGIYKDKDGNITSKYLYERDEDNKVLTYTILDTSDNIISLYEYSYKENNSYVRTVYDKIINSSYTEETIFDEHGNKLRFLQRKSDGTIYSDWNGEYDNDENLTAYTTNDGTVITQKAIIENDNDGKEIKLTIYDCDNELKSIETKEYDENGNIIMLTYSNASGIVIRRTEYEYIKIKKVVS